MWVDFRLLGSLKLHNLAVQAGHQLTSSSGDGRASLYPISHWDDLVIKNKSSFEYLQVRDSDFKP